MEHSPEFEKLKERWPKRISESMLRKYVKAGRITPEEFTEITGIPYQRDNNPFQNKVLL